MLTDDCALAVFLFTRSSPSVFYALEHSFADTVAAAFPLLFDALAFFIVCGLDDRESVSLLELDRVEERAALKGDGV